MSFDLPGGPGITAPLHPQPGETNGADRARAEVGRRGLGATAIDAIVRTTLVTAPISLVERARLLLRRYFSPGPWRIEDDTALASIVGPGTGKHRLRLDDDYALAFGWHGGRFRVEILDVADGVGDDSEVDATGLAGGTDGAASGSRLDQIEAPSLAETFDGAVSTEVLPGSPGVVRFLTGPGSGGSTLWLRTPAEAREPRVAELIGLSPEIIGAQLGPGWVAVEALDDTAWRRVLRPLLAYVEEHFATRRRPAATTPDRQEARARAELGRLDAQSRRDIAFIIDATTSPDAAYRTVAAEKLGAADPFTADRAWRKLMEDGNRAVRRAVIRSIVTVERNELRDHLEFMADDSDAFVRYHAAVGLARLGSGPSIPVLTGLVNDTDARVRVAALAALNGGPVDDLLP